MLEIGICANGLPFDGSTLKKRGLGGSETAVIYVARELAKLGHSVTVFSNPETPGEHDGVQYMPLEQMQKIASQVEWDVFIVSRQYHWLNMDIKTNYRVLWNHDIFTSPELFACLWQTDKAFLLSDYHIADYTEGDGKPAEFKDMVFKTSNGIDLELINRLKQELADQGVQRDPSKIIYTSRPERGLAYLLQMLPKILAVRPDAKIHYCNYSLGNLVPHEADQKRLQIVEQLLRTYKDHVVNLGHLTKEQLYREMITAQCLAYPTAFPEISCITAMEAAACGIPVITTNAFALKETVGHNKSGYLVNGFPDGGRRTMQLDEVYGAKFVRRVLKVMNSDQESERFAKSAPKWIVDQGYTWPQVAKSWSDLFETELADRYNACPEAVHKELQRRGNFAAADLLAGNEIDDEVLMVASSTQAEANDLQTEFNHIVGILERTMKNKPQNVLVYAPSSPLLPVLLSRGLVNAEVDIFEGDEHQRGLIETALKQNEASCNFVDAPKEDHYDLVVCQDAAALAKNPSLVIAACNLALNHKGQALFTTPVGPISSLASVPRTRLWSIGPREWNEILNKHIAQLAFCKLGMTTEQERVGKWIAVTNKFSEDHKLGVIDVLKYKNERPYQKITTCMIAYNAEDWIIRCMKRVLAISDKVQIVIDTKTDDSTVELLEAMNDPRIEWWYNDFVDFEDQRNESLRGTGEDKEPGWVLWLDTDEMLVQDTGLRKFLYGPFFNGFAIPQCHLMIDVHGNRDNPIRVFRAGKPEYKFIGAIHEHAEDTSKGGYDNPISPSMIIPTVQLAHYGYENERQRRQKCSNRNMELLQKDLRKHPKRKLNKLLAMRDYLHIPKWELDAQQRNGQKPAIQPGSPLHRVLETAIDLYVEHLSKEKDRFHELAFPHYQEALQIMAMCGLCYKDSPTPPFSMATSVTAGVGGPARTDIEPAIRWFRSLEESAEWMNANMQSLAQQVAPVSQKRAAELFPLPHVETYKYEDTEGHLLGLGANRIDEHGILV